MSKPLIVLDADVLGRQRTGDETYVSALLRELPELDDELRFAAVTRHPERVPEGVEAIELAARSQVWRMSRSLPRLLRILRPAVTHFQHVVAPGAPSAVVVTIHDLSFERDPKLMRPRDRFFFRTMVPRSVRRADRVIAVSSRTKQDLIEQYGVEEHKIAVIPNGVDEAFSPDGPARDGQPYLLFVGALQARKDPLVAIEALSLADSNLGLVLVGPDKGAAAEARRAVARLGLNGRVEFTGHVEKPALAALYRGAQALVFPSRYEGFGLPVLEAMASGTPVVATAAGAIPEVAGDAAVLVAPGDPAAIAAGVEHAIADRDRLVHAGLERARLYSWTEAARQTLAVYRDLL
ncbi:MAG: glycosyltransferase family 4 protein [Actinomycetota bacterium]|nr:glycosyltransferase family 4 protein [Actinomycetota bacterium]